MTASKLTLISDIGGTNARMALVDNKKLGDRREFNDVFGRWKY